MDEELKRYLDLMRQETAGSLAETREQSERIANTTREHSERITAETRDHSERMAAETRAWSERIVTETREHSERMAAETREHSERVAAETRRHFDVVAERLEEKIATIADAVLHVDQKLDREAADIRSELRHGFADTQAMIKFSHSELDRRITTLEEGFSELKTRVDRLESSTQ